jgi:CBS domain-containing protein
VSFWIDWTEAKSPLDDAAGKYMNRELSTIDINKSVLDAGRLMKERNLGEVLVSQNGVPVGILTERDILNKVVAEDLPTGHVLVRKVMSSPLVSIEEDTPTRKAIEIMEEKGFRRLLVTRKGKPIGMITLQQLLKPVLSSDGI